MLPDNIINQFTCQWSIRFNITIILCFYNKTYEHRKFLNTYTIPALALAPCPAVLILYNLSHNYMQAVK